MLDYVGIAGMMVLHLILASVSNKKTEYLLGLLAVSAVGGLHLYFAYPMIWAVYRAGLGWVQDAIR